MKRPQKVTRETRPNRYARRLYGKKKEEELLLWEEENHPLPAAGTKKKIRTQLNRRLRRRKEDIADGGAYRKELDIQKEER